MTKRKWTPEEVNAAFDAIYPRLVRLADVVPWPMHDAAVAKVRSPESIQQIIAGLRDALDAAEAAVPDDLK